MCKVGSGKRTEKETGKKTDKQGWDKSSHIENLKKLLYFPENQNPKVRYPPLKKEKGEDLPGYEDLKRIFKSRDSKLKRKKLLTDPRTPYHQK